MGQVAGAGLQGGETGKRVQTSGRGWDAVRAARRSTPEAAIAAGVWPGRSLVLRPDLPPAAPSAGPPAFLFFGGAGLVFITLFPPAQGATRALRGGRGRTGRPPVAPVH